MPRKEQELRKRQRALSGEGPIINWAIEKKKLTGIAIVDNLIDEYQKKKNTQRLEILINNTENRMILVYFCDRIKSLDNLELLKKAQLKLSKM